MMQQVSSRKRGGLSSPSRIRNLGRGGLLGWYLYQHRCNQDLRAPSKTAALLWYSVLKFCSSAPMAICSTAATKSSLFRLVAVGPKDLRSLIFRVLPKLLGLPVSLMKKFSKGKPLIGLETAVPVGTLPELPQDVLMEIFATLEIPDLIRAGSVCSSWRSVYKCLRDLGEYKQTPCLLYTYKSAGENVACLYSLVENRAYKLTLPEPSIRGRFLVGSSNGWLITADERSELHLVNPITGEQVALPSVITIEQVKPVTDGSGIIRKYRVSHHTGEKDDRTYTIYAPGKLRDELYFKAFVFPDPCTGSYIVLLIHEPYFQLSFARAGDDKWTWLPLNTFYRDCIYKDGLVYALTVFGEIDAFDLTASIVTMKVIVNKFRRTMLCFQSCYIVWAPWGDLLQVWRTFDVLQKDEDTHRQWPCWTTTKVTVHKVDFEAKELVEATSLPNHILFLGHNDSLCLHADGHPQLKANHAYFTDDRVPATQVKTVPRDILAVDLENGRRKKIASQDWSYVWPWPTWITPNLTKMNLAFSK